MGDDFEWFASEVQDKLKLYVVLKEAQLSALYQHYQLLIRWNSKINLTSIRKPADIVVRHYCESLFFSANMPDAHQGTSLADIGSGAGFPGIPMAILRPDWQLTLVESHQRKAVFLRESSRSLPNVVIAAKRAEELNLRFDWVVSRAVTPTDVLTLVPKLGQRAGFLIGAGELELIQDHAGFVWWPPLRVPWGENRWCLYGRSTWNSFT